jgi:Putative zinc-finger
MSDYVDGQLTSRQRLRLEAHAGFCPDCGLPRRSLTVRVWELRQFGRPANRDPRGLGGEHWGVRDALSVILQPQHLRRTITIALVVGTILTAINHADVIARGDASSATLAKAALNYLVPFIVSNLGLLVGTRGDSS